MIILLTKEVVQWETSKLTSLVYAVQRIVMNSDVPRELKMEAQDTIERCLVVKRGDMDSEKV